MKSLELMSQCIKHLGFLPSAHIIYSIENRIIEFLDHKNLCIAVEELFSYVVLGPRYKYLLFVYRHLECMTSACITQFEK